MLGGDLRSAQPRDGRAAGGGSRGNEGPRHINAAARRQPTQASHCRAKLADCDPKEKSKGQYEAWCPAHDGTHPNGLSVKEGDDGRVLLHCFAGCSFGQIMESLGLSGGDGFIPTDREPVRAKTKAKPVKDRQDKGEPAVHQSPERAISAALKTIPGGKLSSIGPWLYKDTERFEVFRVYRIDRPDGKKEFRPVYPDNGGWRVGYLFKSGLPPLPSG